MSSESEGSVKEGHGEGAMERGVHSWGVVERGAPLLGGHREGGSALWLLLLGLHLNPPGLASPVRLSHSLSKALLFSKALPVPHFLLPVAPAGGSPLTPCLGSPSTTVPSGNPLPWGWDPSSSSPCLSHVKVTGSRTAPSLEGGSGIFISG